MTDETNEQSLTDAVAAAFDSAAGEETTAPTPQVPELDAPESTEPVVEAPKYEAPISWKAEVKSRFNELPVDVQQEILRREEEVHKGFTKHDEERTFGRSMKEAFTPYMAMIQAEGGTPDKIVKDYLNADYLLRTGSQEQKIGLLRAIAENAGVDLAGLAAPQEYVDPDIAAMKQELERVKQMANPQFVQQQLQQQMESARIDAEVKAFASDPSNDLFEKVRTTMGTLMQTGSYANLKEAYEAAVLANPETRAIYLQRQQAADQAKRKAVVESKKNAGSSIAGSPAISGNAISPNSSLIDDVAAAYEAASSSSRI